MMNHPTGPEQHPVVPPSRLPPAPDPTIPPEVRQAAWRYGARQKNPGLAWGLWGGSFFILLIPLHGFYLGRILQSILRGLMSVGAPVIFFASYMAWILTLPSRIEEGATGFPAPGPLIWVGFALAAVLGTTCLVWWIRDATRMGRRVETLNERIRQEVADEHGVAPWSF